ncbi:MAG: bis(5'-nucleosyl)-tetraphosphatase (symmetrical) YqeK [Lachnospiraceae bacterium]
MNPKISKISKKLQKELDAERYQHTLGVMYTAASLAMCHGENIESALLAGLLHDCAKCIPGHEKIKLCKKYKLEISPVEEKNPSLLHAKLGAYLAEKKYDITNQDILNAINSHTTGRPGMTLLEKIIYIADYMEPGRAELPNMADVRKMAFENIDDCLFRILKDSLVYLKSRDLPIDIMTEKTYNYYKQELGK